MIGDTVIPHEVLDAMLDAAVSAALGPIVEVGVYQGGSAYELEHVAYMKSVDLHLFDTFTGMPFARDEDTHKVGDFSDTSVEAVQRLVPRAKIYPGVFPATLPETLNRIGFVHVDVDQYQSTYDAIKHLWWRVRSGGVMWFDDCELAPALRAIHELMPYNLLQQGPQGRLWARKP